MDRQTFINAVSRIWEEIEQSVIINSFNEITKYEKNRRRFKQ